ncbi:mitotic checkpoint serine/threonine-protein kinase BUB1-like [Culicoides brevitarsis]|uniref:mitotic checkpoint serine/threonine-protein kinase BUB1-like n=1 Tax=Culicoides brevitarsis TaxID=469753 RepID=UPI00307C579A
MRSIWLIDGLVRTKKMPIHRNLYKNMIDFGKIRYPRQKKGKFNKPQCLVPSMKNLELMQKKAKSKSTGMLNPVSEKVAFQSASPNPSPKPSPFAQRNKTMKPIASIQPIMQTRSPIPSTINRSSPLRINPFALSFKQRMVEKTDIKERLRNLPSCTFKHNGRSLSKGQSLDFGGEQFYVIKALAKGGYGTIYTAKAKSTGEIYALKQEKPPNLWEFYVCLELKERIHNQQILPAFTTITHGLLTNDHSILATNYAPYGSLIEVFNKVRVETHRCCEELVVISVAHQILTIFQYLHEAKIIHADVKPENFLVIRDVGPHPYIQLIDFGVSIDMKLVQNEFPNFDGFRAASKKDLIIEMHENRPWSYQIDYFGIAGTIHVMLFGEHMKIRKDNIWKPKAAIKRYMNQRLWEKFFCELLNIVGEKPNVEEIIKILDGELKTPENHARDKFIEFNRILKSK